MRLEGAWSLTHSLAHSLGVEEEREGEKERKERREKEGVELKSGFHWWKIQIWGRGGSEIAIEIRISD
jgi:hypothetical protein